MEYRNALVTGASSGLGRGLATWLVKRGVRVYAAARRGGALEQLQAELGENLLPVCLDVADADDTHARIQALDKECGGLDLVVANAGVGDETYGKRVDWKRVRRVIDVNVTGAVATLVAPLPGMVDTAPWPTSTPTTTPRSLRPDLRRVAANACGWPTLPAWALMHPGIPCCGWWPVRSCTWCPMLCAPTPNPWHSTAWTTVLMCWKPLRPMRLPFWSVDS